MVENYGLPSRYSDFSPLGSGGIGTVFKAVDSRIDKKIALKILNNLDSALSTSIENEFSTLVALKHPYLIHVYDFGQSESGHSYFTMDYINGPNLTEYFKSPVTVSLTNDILMDILEALDYLAKKNIIHGDIKPENILISNETNTHPVLVDFGLSTIAAVDHDKLFGTPRFLAPEILSSRQYSTKSDLYALGHTFIESLTKNSTPIAHDLTSEYFDKSYDTLSDLFGKSDVKYPRNLASYIIKLSDPSLELRPDTTSQAIQMLSAISRSSAKERVLLCAGYIVREEIDSAVDQFIEGNDFDDRVLILDGPIGAGKRSLMAKAISKAQLLKYRVLNYIGTQSEGFSLKNILDVLSINLSSESSKKLFKQHHNLLSKIKKAEDARELDNLGVIYSNIVEYIHLLSEEQPVLIVMPNIECYGLDTIRFITHLINEIDYLNADIKVILSQTTDYPHDVKLDKHISSLTNNANSLVARGFNASEAKELCHKLFDSDLLSDAEIESILSFTDGLPLYLLDYFNYLLLNGIITKSDRTYYVDHKQLSKSYSLPKYDAMVNYIVSNMTLNVLHLLQLLSIHKQPISIDLLDNFVSYDLPRIVKDCDMAGLIELQGNTIQLKSPILKNYLCQNIDTDQLIPLNRTLAEYTLVADSENCSVIADHFIKAQAPEKAYSYAVIAYDNYLSNHEYYSAYNILSSLNNSFEETTSNEMVTTVLEKLGSLEVTLGYLDDSLNKYLKLIDIVADEVPKSKYYNQIGRIELIYKGNTDKAVEYYKLALDIARRNSSVEIESETLIFLGLALRDVSYLETAAAISKDTLPKLYIRALGKILFLCTFSGATDKCQALDTELSKHLSNDDPDILSDICFAKYVNAFYTGNYSVADTMLHNLINLAEQSCDEIKRIRLLNSLGSIHFSKGQYNHQIETLNIAYYLVNKYQASDYIVITLSNIALAHIALANYSAALKLIKEVELSIEKFHVSDPPTFYFSIGARAFRFFGALYRDKYFEYLESLERAAHRSNNKISLGHMNLGYGDYNYFGMTFKDSGEHFLKALTIFEAANAKDDMLEALLKLSLAHHHMDDLETARDYGKQAAKIFREINCGYLKPLYSYVIALSECHDNPESLAPMLEAIDVSREFGTREWTWQIQFELARLYKQAGDISNSVKYCRESINTLKEITESFDNPEQISSYLQVPLRAQVFDFVKSLKP